MFGLRYPRLASFSRRTVEPVSRILQVLRTTTHNGFPVFAEEGSTEEDVVSVAPSNKALVSLANSSSSPGKRSGRAPF